MILDSELADRLKKFSDESGMPKTTIIEKALRLYLADKEEVIRKLNK
jgi:predicted DNA-binding protein